MKKNKLGRNDPCHCGSGKKYKKCCYLQGEDLDASNTSPPPIKISEAILKISEPWLRKYPQRERITVIINIAVIAWNMSLVPEEDREDIENQIIDIMPKEVDAVEVATIVELVGMLFERKVKYYKDINYVIKNHNLSFSDNGQFNLDINSVPFDG